MKGSAEKSSGARILVALDSEREEGEVRGTLA